MESTSELDDAFYEPYLAADNLVKLSHLNTRSSVLAPEHPGITSQYLALQQLNAHQQMISRAKSTVDTSAPKSMQSYISVTSRAKKKRWQNLNNGSRAISMEELHARPSSSSRLQVSLSGEEDNMSSSTTLNKGVQTGIPLENYYCKTADKISWYLEALSQGELQSQTLMSTNNLKSISRFSDQTFGSNKKCKRIVRGDIMDWHRDSFVKTVKPFSPRIVADTSAKSKVRDMRCYNPPFRRRKKNGSSHSSDTFESYSQKDESDDDKSETEKSTVSSSVEEEGQPNATPFESVTNHQVASTSVQMHNREEYLNSLERLKFLRRRNENEYFHTDNGYEEDKYLNFLGKVTEDILRSGIYSDQAIQQSFEFHMQFYQDDEDKDKRQSLLNQVLNSLRISMDDSEDISNRRNLFSNFIQTDSPPEKESPDNLPLADLLTSSDTELASRLMEDLNLNAHTSPHISCTEPPNGEQIMPQENGLSFAENL